MAGELGHDSPEFLHKTISICAPVDLSLSAETISKPHNRLYERYFLKSMLSQAQKWLTNHQKISTMLEFDHAITAPLWGFKDAYDYYDKCSCLSYLPRIKSPCHMLFAADDPFINYQPALTQSLSANVKIGLCQNGGHMGFLGWAGHKHRYFWLDRLLLNWIDNS